MIIKDKFLTDTRITGLLYLGLAVTGIFVFLYAKSSIYIYGNALATHTNLLEKESLARFGIVAELALVIFQVLVAMWFYKLFRAINSFAAISLAVFGTVNAVLILVASAMWLSTLNASIAGESATIVFNLFSLHESIWFVSGLFFGLWLLPMGYLAAKVKMPLTLAGILVVGGVGYIIATLITVLFPDQKMFADILVLPSTIGEFWMIGYLLHKPNLSHADEL